MYTCFFSLYSLLIFLVVFVFQAMLIYLDSISPGLEFHLGKSTQGYVKASDVGPTPFCSIRTNAFCDVVTGNRTSGTPWTQELAI